MIEPPSLHRYCRVSKEMETIGQVDDRPVRLASEETHARTDEPDLVLSDERAELN
jgi:hypothetical protein